MVTSTLACLLSMLRRMISLCKTEQTAVVQDSCSSNSFQHGNSCSSIHTAEVALLCTLVCTGGSSKLRTARQGPETSRGLQVSGAGQQ